MTMVIGTFASGATQATNWTRLARSARSAVWASMIGFFAGNGLMIAAHTARSSISKPTSSR